LGFSCTWDGSPILWQFRFCATLPTDCLAYTQFHLQELIRLWFLKSDWHEGLGLFRNALDTASLQQWAALPAEKKEAYLN
jgi:hypothetical protein